jgi:hypothetical protein
LVGEAELVSPRELQRQVLEPEGRHSLPKDLEATGHPEVDEEGAAVVEPEEQVLAATSQVDDLAPDEASPGRLDAERSDDAGELADAEPLDRPTDDPVEQRSSHGFDFWEFWHTGGSARRGVAK